MTFSSMLLIVTGGVAAYKAAELARLAGRRGARVTCALTEGATRFVTPLLFASLTGNPAYAELFDEKNEAEMGHIRLSRENDVILVAPATADFISKAANGAANDLASTILLASDKPVFMAPAMNPRMYAHPAVVRNLALLRQDGVRIVPPALGEAACGECGEGRMAEPADILDFMEKA